MNKQIKIAIYSGLIPSTTFIERLINGVSSRGIRVCLFGNRVKKISYNENVSVLATSTKWGKLINLLKYSILLYLFHNQNKKKLDALIDKNEQNTKALKAKYYPVLYQMPDVFHLQWAKSLSDWIWVKEFGIKLILSLRGTHITISPKCNSNLDNEYTELFPKVDAFHAVSNSMTQHVEKYNVPKDKISVVYNGLVLEDFPFKGKTKINSPLKIISVGRAHWVKGYTIALEAVSFLHEKGFDFQYDIIGVEENEELLVLRHQLGLTNKVVFKKQLPFEVIKKEIFEADVLLLPSIEEGIANVVLEAMALGTLVVTTNCGGMQEVVSDGENGFIVPIRDCESLAKSIQNITALSLEEYNRMTQNARTTIEQQHSEKAMIEGMINLYTTIFNG